MALKRKSHFFVVSLAVVLLFCSATAAQNPGGNPEKRPRSQDASSIETDRLPTSNENDFRRRVEARWQAARKGQIELYVISDRTDTETYQIRVVVTRVPSGADGMTMVTLPANAIWGALLKLDDVLRVRITSETAGAVTIEPLVHGTDSLIQHLNPGGHAEWRWIVKKRAKDQEDRFQLQADVVYRRDASSAAPPIVIYRSAESVISLPHSPTSFLANPHAVPAKQQED